MFGQGQKVTQEAAAVARFRLTGDAAGQRREGRGKRVATPTPWPAQLQAVKGADWEGLLASGWAPLGALLLAISVRSIAELVW